MQPLDVSYFKRLKAKWNKEREEYTRQNHGRFVTKSNSAGIFQKAWDAINDNKEIANEFCRTGISPFRRLSKQDLLKDKLLSPAQGLNRPLQQESASEETEVIPTESVPTHDEHDESTSQPEAQDIQRLAKEHAESFLASLLSSMADNTSANVDHHDQSTEETANTNTVEQVSFQLLPGLNGDVPSADFVSSVCTTGPSTTRSDNAEVSVTSTDSDKVEFHFDFSLDQDDLFESRADYEQVSANIQSLLSSMEGSFSDMDGILDVGLENSFSEPTLTNSKSTELCNPKSTELCDPKSTELCDPNQQSFLIPNQQSFLIVDQVQGKN